MRDAGLEKAIEKAGGVSALARALGVAQPSVSNWERVPADRVVSVEKISGVPRAVLRPDLYESERMRVIGFAGWSGSGKTTLITKLIPALRGRGLSVSTIKHAHHAFDIDTPGKDSYEHRAAGATEVMISSAARFALMRELRGESEWTLAQLLRKMTPVDLVVVEGFKKEPHPKIEVWRAATGMPPLAREDAQVRAVATADPLTGTSVERLDLDDLEQIADAVLRLAEPVDEVAARLAR